jgi:hypothetical protein
VGEGLSVLNIPSKTFLLGEYVALNGGPCLILTTPPYFQIAFQQKTFQKSPPSPLSPFSPYSPAGKWIEKHRDFFKHYHIDFSDPHEGKGGFGASSAQFIGVYQAIYPIEKTREYIENLLEAYWETFPKDTQVLPSGADIVAQIFGGVTYWHRLAELSPQRDAGDPSSRFVAPPKEPLCLNAVIQRSAKHDEGSPWYKEILRRKLASLREAAPLDDNGKGFFYDVWHSGQRAWSSLDDSRAASWPFPDLSYCLIRTGQKQNTHQNLSKLSTSACAQMAQVVEDGLAAFTSKNALAFIEAVTHYARWMKQEKCVVPNTEALIQQLYASTFIEAAKGCGALGADVILALLRPEKMQNFLEWLRMREWEVVNFSDSLESL